VTTHENAQQTCLFTLHTVTIAPRINIYLGVFKQRITRKAKQALVLGKLRAKKSASCLQKAPFCVVFYGG